MHDDLVERKARNIRQLFCISIECIKKLYYFFMHSTIYNMHIKNTNNLTATYHYTPILLSSLTLYLSIHITLKQFAE